jgi:hypothetical protein
MVSAEGEVVNFFEKVVTRGAVEDWLNAIEAMMQVTIRSLTQCVPRCYLFRLGMDVSLALGLVFPLSRPSLIF